jgi:hypothetical protein
MTRRFAPKPMRWRWWIRHAVHDQGSMMTGGRTYSTSKPRQSMCFVLKESASKKLANSGELAKRTFLFIYLKCNFLIIYLNYSYSPTLVRCLWLPRYINFKPFLLLSVRNVIIPSILCRGKMKFRGIFYYYCSVSRWRPQKVDKRMVLEYTHGLFIT